MVELAIIAYVALFIGVGIYAARKIKNETDFILAGRTVGVALGTFSIFATWFGAETVMGSSGAIAEQGLAGGRADPFGYSLTLLLMSFFLAFRLRSMGLTTLGDFFKNRYGPSTEYLASFIMTCTATIWSAAQLFAFGTILAYLTGMDHTTAILVCAVGVMIYTLLGGMIGSVISDFIHGIILIIGLGTLTVFVFRSAGGFTEGLGLITPEQLSFSTEGESFLTRIDYWAIPVLGSLVSQEAISRMLAAKSPEVARKSALLASLLYFTIGLMPLMIALVGRHLAPDLEHRDEFIIEIAKMLLHPVAFAIFCGALISAILSTINTNFLAVGALISHNILRPLSHKLSDARKLILTRVSVLMAGAIAAFLATNGQNIYELLLTESSFGTAGLLVCLIGNLVFHQRSVIASSATLAIGLFMAFFADFLGLEARFLSSIIVCTLTFTGLVILEKLLLKNNAGNPQSE